MFWVAHVYKVKHPISVKIKGDENCYFRAISYSICGEEIYHADIRNAVCDFIFTFDADLKPFLVKGKGKEYVLKSNMRRHGIWASEIKILATAKILCWDVFTYHNFKWLRYAHISRNSLLMLCTWIIIQVYILTLLHATMSEFFIEFYSILSIGLVTILITIQVMFLYLNCHMKSSLEWDTSIWEMWVQRRLVHHVNVLCFMCITVITVILHWILFCSNYLTSNHTDYHTNYVSIS